MIGVNSCSCLFKALKDWKSANTSLEFPNSMTNLRDPECSQATLTARSAPVNSPSPSPCARSLWKHCRQVVSTSRMQFKRLKQLSTGTKPFPAHVKEWKLKKSEKNGWKELTLRLIWPSMFTSHEPNCWIYFAMHGDVVQNAVDTQNSGEHATSNYEYIVSMIWTLTRSAHFLNYYMHMVSVYNCVIMRLV